MIDASPVNGLFQAVALIMEKAKTEKDSGEPGTPTDQENLPQVFDVDPSSLFSVDDQTVVVSNIVTRGTGYETLQVSKAITKVLQFMLKVLRKCTIFCFTISHYG